jgi:hypothetical protein
MTIALTLTLSAIAPGLAINASDVTTPLSEIEVILENLLNGTQSAEQIRFDQLAGAPSTPAASKYKVYFKSTGMYYIDSTGTETQLGTSGTGSVISDPLGIQVFS